MKISNLFAVGLLLCANVVSAQDSLNVTQVGRIYDQAGAVWMVALSGDFAYLAALDSGMRVVNVSDPANPHEVSSYHTPGTAYGIAVSGDFAYVADMDSGMRVVNISDPANPHEVGVYYPPHAALSVAVSGNLAFVGDSNDGLRIVDVSNPTEPHEVGAYIRILGQSPVACIAVRDTLVYIGGLEVINVADPANPRQISSDQVPGEARGVAVSGNLAFNATLDDGLRITDVSNPRHLVALGHYDTPGRSFGVAVDGNFAYVGDQTALRVVDVSDPANPTEVGHYASTGIAVNPTIGANGLIYLAEYTHLGIYRFTGANSVEPVAAPIRPGGFTLAASFPNPFNSTTRIGFSLPGAGYVRVTLANLSGREVARVVEGEFAAGDHSMAYSAGALPSGIYLLRAESNGKAQTEKITLVR